MTLSWPTVEAAWVAAVRGALGGSEELAIFWAHHRNPYPVDSPCVVLKIEECEGADAGEARQFFNEDGALNEEIEQDLTRFWLTTLTIDLRVATKDASGAASPHALATHLLTCIRQESVQEALQQAGVGLVSDGKIIFPAEQLNGVWVPTAKFPVEFYAATTVTEKLGYIATWGGSIRTPDVEAPDQAFTLTPEQQLSEEEP